MRYRSLIQMIHRMSGFADVKASDSGGPVLIRGSLLRCAVDGMNLKAQRYRPLHNGTEMSAHGAEVVPGPLPR